MWWIGKDGKRIVLQEVTEIVAIVAANELFDSICLESWHRIVHKRIHSIVEKSTESASASHFFALSVPSLRHLQYGHKIVTNPKGLLLEGCTWRTWNLLWRHSVEVLRGSGVGGRDDVEEAGVTFSVLEDWKAMPAHWGGGGRGRISFPLQHADFCYLGCLPNPLIFVPGLYWNSTTHSLG